MGVLSVGAEGYTITIFLSHAKITSETKEWQKNILKP
jgi:hypothetical protein